MASLRSCWPLLILLLGGCAPVSSLFESEDLVAVLHSNVSDYTLLIYRRPDGFERRVLRHAGQCELILERREGDLYVLRERGAEPRRIEPETVAVLNARIEALIYSKDAPDQPRTPVADT
ncbi:MAG: hypothetical protein R2834_15515 [Rhodothermales bacterium]